jgi:hypothetical protein
MKKALVVFLALAMIAGVFADEPVADLKVVDFTGNAAVTWGYDLENGGHGFSNSTTIQFKLNLFNAGRKATSGEGVWGDIEIKFQDDSNGFWETGWGEAGKSAALSMPTVQIERAKINFGPAYLSVTSGDALAIGAWDQTMPTAWNLWGNGTISAGTSKSNGIGLGFASGLFGVDAEFRTSDQYASDYAGSIAPYVTVGGAKILAAASYVLGEGEGKGDLGVAGKVEYKYDLNDTLFIQPMVIYASTTKDGAEFDKGQIEGSVLFGWGGTTWDTCWDYYLFNFKNYTPGVSAHVTYDLVGSDGDLGIQFVAGNIVPNLSAAAQVSSKFVDFADNYAVTLGLNYAVSVGNMTITPKVATILTSTVTKLKVGAVLGGAIPNTSFEVNWGSDDLGEDNGKIAVTAKVSL